MNSLAQYVLCAVLAALLYVPAAGGAETLSGEVVGLSDGDTVTVLDAKHRQYKVRLAGIDAPERRQPFGARSRQALAAMVFRQQVAVEWQKTDRYGRLVGVVRISGRDVGLEQVKSGLAWHYKEYQSEQTTADRMLYDQAEEQARAARRGLWRDALPEAPWEFRRRARHR